MVKTRRQAKESVLETPELKGDDTDSEFKGDNGDLMPTDISRASNAKRRLLLFFLAFCYIAIMVVLATYGGKVSETIAGPIGSEDGGDTSNIPSCMQSSTEKNPLVRAARCFGKRVSKTNRQFGHNLKQALKNAGKRGRMNRDDAESSSTTSEKVGHIDQMKAARK